MNESDKNKKASEALTLAQIRLSSDKIVFTTSSAYCHRCANKLLIISERNQPLRCNHCGNQIAGPVCRFCQDFIGTNLLSRGDVPSCLKGIDKGWVRFCEKFTQGRPFGYFWKYDKTRREEAEKVLEKTVKKYCTYCNHWKTKRVYEARDFPIEQVTTTESPKSFCEIRMGFSTDKCPYADDLPKYLHKLDLFDRYVTEE